MNPLPVIHILGTLALVLLPACASSPGGQGPSGGASPDGTPCVDAPSPRTLLVVDCVGGIVPGLAGWEVHGSAIVLGLAGQDPSAARSLVESWPVLSAPPWLGHSVGRIVVLPGNQIRVEFGRSGPPSAGSGDVARELPLMLFADPRLAPPEFQLDESGLVEDVRDRIDEGDAPVFTRHDRSVGYGRTLGREVSLARFDRRYLIVAPGGLADGLGEAFRGAVVEWWVRGGAEGARRSPDPDQGHSRCEGPPNARRSTPRRTNPGTTSQGSESGPVELAFPAADPAARQIADRVVSAALPGGALNAWFPAGLSARPIGTAGSAPADASEMLRVVVVQVGSVHACSIRGEILASMPALESDRLELTDHVVPVGETALFRIGPEVTLR